MELAENLRPDCVQILALSSHVTLGQPTVALEGGINSFISERSALQEGNSGGCCDSLLLSHVLTLCLSFHIGKLGRVIIPCVIGLGTGLDELIYIKHLKQCLVHRKHYVMVCFCHYDHSFPSRAHAIHFVRCKRQKYSVTFRGQFLSLVLRCLRH